MGVHPGDSYCTAPMLTISSELQEKLQDYSYRIVEAIKVITGMVKTLAGRILMIDAMTMEFREMKLPKHDNCSVCGTQA